MSLPIKKAPQTILSMVKIIDPTVSNNTNLERAWEVISEYWNIEGELYAADSRSNNVTSFNIIYNGNLIHTCTWPTSEAWDNKEGEFNFNLIYKDVLEWLIKSKTLKKSRIRKSSKSGKIDLPKNCKKIQEDMDIKSKKSEVLSVDFEDLKRQKMRLYQKIRNDKKKGLDVAILERQYKQICEQLKNK